MNFRTAGAFAALLVGLTGWADLALAQYYPPPPQMIYPDDDDDFYDPVVRSRPLPSPPGGGVQHYDPTPPRYGRGYPIDPDTGVELVPLPPDYARRNAPGGPVQGFPAPAASGQYAVRPPVGIGPGQGVAPSTGAAGPIPDARFAALPPEDRPETGPAKELPPQFRRTIVGYKTKEPPGTLIVDTQNTYLYLVLEKGKVLRYGIGVGREGFTWSGTERVSRMAEWPDWHPPEEMIERQPYLPRFMAGGETNPLGARALYLGSTVYRIHGTNQPSTIGTFVSSGCIRLTNEDVMDLYSRVKVGTRVVVLPGKAPSPSAGTQLSPSVPPSSASANAATAPAVVRPGATITGAPLPPPPMAR